MVSPARQAFDRLREADADGRIDALCIELGVRLLDVLGSATHASLEPRDLDISVWFDREPRPLELLDRLVQLTDCDRIDLLDLGRAEPVARARGLTGIRLFESQPGLWATTQMAALAEARDTAHLRELDRQALLG